MALTESFDLNSIQNLELLAKQVVEGFIIGLHKSPFHGFSVEFAEHRLYNDGESTKNIDWKVFARTDKMFTKKYEEETNLRCHIVIDNSSSMHYPILEGKSTHAINKITFSVIAAASLMLPLQKQRDAFGLSIFEEDLRYQSQTKSNVSHYHLLLNHLNKILADKTLHKGTQAADALHQIAETIHKRSLVVIFSDMFDHENKDRLFDALQHLKHAKHEVILFHVVDEQTEMLFEFENRPYLFVDMETKEEVRLQSNEVKEYYSSQIIKFKEELKMKSLQYSVDFIEVDINKGYTEILQSYIRRRSKLIK